MVYWHNICCKRHSFTNNLYFMIKKILTFLVGSLILIGNCFAQSEDLNSVADNIIGEYSSLHRGKESKIKIFKEDDGKYSAQIFWVSNPLGTDGKVRLDVKNPDKSLRNVPCNEVVLIKGMSYDAKKKCWKDAKIYDPTRGLRVNVRCFFGEDGILQVKGTVLGIGETAHWVRIVGNQTSEQ